MPATDPKRACYGQEQFGSNQYHPISRPSAKMRYRMTFKKQSGVLAPSRDVPTTAIFNDECQQDPPVHTQEIHQIDSDDVAMDYHPYDAQIELVYTNTGGDDHKISDAPVSGACTPHQILPHQS